MFIKKSLICFVVAASTFAAQANNLVVNGSFEQISVGNSQAPGSWGIYNNITGWAGAPNIEVRDNVAGAAQDGSNYVELDTTNNSGMFQVIDGNGLYNLSFWFSPRERVALAYRLILGRVPTEREQTVAAQFLAQSPLNEFCRALFNLNEFVYAY